MNGSHRSWVWAVAALALWASQAGADDREVFTRVCTRCHSMEGQIPSERSHKAWELTVERMKRYAEANEMMAFSDRESEAVLRFLTAFPENKAIQLDLLTTPTVEPEPAAPAQPAVLQNPAPAPAGGTGAPGGGDAPPPATAPAAVPATAPATPPPAGPPPAVAQAGRDFAKLPPLPPPPVPLSMLAVAKATGYIAIVLLGALVFSGLMRRRMGHAFKGIHVTLAAVLAFCATAHSVIFVWRYGTPGILWFWFGLLALGVILGALLGGAYRKRMRGLFFRLHKLAAVGGLALTVLHWVWYYL